MISITDGYNGYHLDKKSEIKMFGVKWQDSYYSIQLLQQDYTIQNCLSLIKDILVALESTTSKGFIPSYDLRVFPIVSEILPSLLHNQEDITYVRGAKSMESYKWIYNIVVLNLYLVTLETLNIHESTSLDYLDLQVLSDDLYSKLDPSIRYHIQKRGISLKENTCIGFDTEFTKKGSNLNEMVSAQLAVTTKTYVQIPKQNLYCISQIDEQSNMLIKQHTTSEGLNYKKIEMSIQQIISSIRKLKYSNHDENILRLTESLRVIKGLQYSEREDRIVFSLPRSIVQPYIHYGNSFSMKEIIRISSGLAKEHHERSYKVLLKLIKELCSSDINLITGQEQNEIELAKKYVGYSEVEELNSSFEQRLPLLTNASENVLEDLAEQKSSRQYLTEVFPQKLSVSRSKNYYIIAHLTPADLSLLSDFELIKEELSIVNGSFVTLGKPIKYCGRNIHIRDTMLLAPGTSKSLASIGKLYGEAISKVQISKEDLVDMKGFLVRDKAQFTEYALRDAIISLIHASWMEDFNFSIGSIGIPLSLSSLGRNYVKSKWVEESYTGYQISSKYQLGDVSSTITPKGLNVIRDIGFVLPYYIYNYKGGRNECFMYGVERDTVWYDYDLTSAYTTVMSMAGHPEYESCRRISKSELKELSLEDILYSYLIINADFEFPIDTKYPSIPCYVDENCTVYPLSGECVLTGAEYLLAKEQNCKLVIKDVIYTPFKRSEFREHKPFAKILQEIQAKRREYAKGTLSNMIYKELGNGIYGSVVRGLGNKRKFDIKTQGTVRMTGDNLSNPLIASWTTAFIRSIIGECLHSIQRLGGLVVSVTTDGFITNIAELENKISTNTLLTAYKNIRMDLSGDNTSLELKSCGKGIIAWSTRGQLGLGSKVIATTGFQHRAYASRELLQAGFLESIKSEYKTLGYIQSTLRTASDIYKKGGHVTMVYTDRQFRMHFDHRRLLQWESTIPSTIEQLIDSKPIANVTQAKNLRYIARMSKTKLYTKFSSVKSLNSYKDEDELAIRKFLKGLLSTPPCFNLSRDDLLSYPLIIEYIQNYNPKLKYSPATLAKIKKSVNSLGVKWLPIAKSKESEKFVEYVLLKFPDFDVDEYYNK